MTTNLSVYKATNEADGKYNYNVDNNKTIIGNSFDVANNIITIYDKNKDGLLSREEAKELFAGGGLGSAYSSNINTDEKFIDIFEADGELNYGENGEAAIALNDVAAYVVALDTFQPQQWVGGTYEKGETHKLVGNDYSQALDGKFTSSENAFAANPDLLSALICGRTSGLNSVYETHIKDAALTQAAPASVASTPVTEPITPVISTPIVESETMTPTTTSIAPKTNTAANQTNLLLNFIVNFLQRLNIIPLQKST